MTPFLMVLIIPAFFTGAGAAFALLAAVFFRTTVDVLPSLDSETPLILRAVLVAAARVEVAVAVAAAARLVRVVDVVLLAVPEPLDELVVEALVALRCAAVARVARAFSTMLLRIFVALAVFTGETGRAIMDFVGDAGRSRGATRELDVVGDRTWPRLRDSAGAALPRVLFLGFSTCSTAFSLSPPSISSLQGC